MPKFITSKYGAFHGKTSKAFTGSFKGPLSRVGMASRGGLNKFLPSWTGMRMTPRFSLDMKHSWMFTANQWDKILEPARIKALRYMAREIQHQAKREIKRRDRPSDPGEAPTAWYKKGKKGKFDGLRTIWYDYDPRDGSYVVGPIYFHSTHKNISVFPQATIPATLEYGGYERVYKASVIQLESTVWGGFEREELTLPAGRLVYIEKRPYMRPAERKTRVHRSQILRNILGYTPICRSIAEGMASSAKGKGLKSA